MPSPFDTFLEAIFEKRKWKKYFSLLPRRTITGRLAIGPMNRRAEMVLIGHRGIERDETSGAYEMEGSLYEEQMQYATDKELFVLSLEGKNEQRKSS